MIKAGIYQHFKGNYYQVLHIGKHSETEELMVIYHPLYGSYEQTGIPDIWVRPLAMFDETIVRDNQQMKRFTFIKANAQ